MPWHHWRTKPANHNDLASAVTGPASMAAAALSLTLQDVNTPLSAEVALPNVEAPTAPVSPDYEADGNELDGGSNSSDSYRTTSCQGSEKGWKDSPEGYVEEHPEVVAEDYLNINLVSELGLDVPLPTNSVSTDPYLKASSSPRTASDQSLGAASSMAMSPASSSSEVTPRASVSKPLPLINISNEDLEFLETKPFFRGIYSEVWLADWKGQTVAVKVLRCLKLSKETMERKRARELKTWAQLRHASILPLLGFVEDIEPKGELGALVSPFRRRGNSMAYLRRLPHQYPARITMWLHVIEGLSFLHEYSPRVVHGDLKPENIVIDDNRCAQICDFGLAQLIIESGHSGLTTTTPYTGTTRYKSRELVEDPREIPTTTSDVYALGCLGLQFVFGMTPYASYDESHSIENAIKRGELPTAKPSNATGEIDDYWNQLGECWDRYPEYRPSAVSVGQYVIKHRDSLALQLEREEWDNYVSSSSFQRI